MIREFHQISLRGRNSFGVDQRAARLVEFETAEDLRTFFAAGIPGRWTVLAGGNNILFTEDYDGVLLTPVARQIALLSDDGDEVRLRVEAGVEWDDLVEWAVERGLWGIENLSLIPGKAGAAPVQNIGAYGVELAERLSSVTVYDRAEKVVRVLTVEECDFSYRHSIMKTEAGRNFVVLSVTLRLPAVWTPVLGYKDLEAEIEARGLTAETVTAPVMSEIVRAVRARKLPDPAVIGNAGSFFTNPIVTKVHWHELLTKHPSLVYYRLGGGRMKLAAAWLIEAAGFKGLAEGPAGVYEHHALIIVNRGGATGEDVMALAERIQKRVFELFGVKLEMEPVRLG